MNYRTQFQVLIRRHSQCFLRKNRPLPVNSFFHHLAFLTFVLLSGLAVAEETPSAINVEKPASASPWGFNLSTYLWLPGMNGSFSAGTHSGSVDANFIDIVDKSRRVPLGFMGRFEAHYERFGFYLDGNYMNMQLKPALGNVSEGIDSELGLMDYGLMYRIFGPKAAEIPNWQGKKRPNSLEVYAGARTIWLANSVAFSGPFGLIERTPTTGKSFTSPIIGGRFSVEFTPSWYLLVDANIGGFGVQNVDFTGGVMGMLGYRLNLFGYPASVEAGYKAVRYNVDNGGAIATNATLNGPFIGLTGYW